MKALKATYAALRPAFYDRRRDLFEPIGKPRDFFARQKISVSFPHLVGRKDIGELVARDDFPIPHLEDREKYYEESDLDYWLSGLDDFIRVMDLIPSLDAPSRCILDFGGASGRFMRHCAANLPDAQLTLAEVNINHVDWVQKYMGGKVSAAKVPALPPLPFADDQFDLVTAFSVFTHLDEYEIPTLRELVRITKPGGHLYLTIHSDYSWSSLPNNHINGAIKHLAPYDQLQLPGPMPKERMSFRYSETLETYNCHIFLSRDYIRDNWSRYAKIEDIILDGHGNQDVVVLRK